MSQNNLNFFSNVYDASYSSALTIFMSYCTFLFTMVLPTFIGSYLYSNINKVDYNTALMNIFGSSWFCFMCGLFVLITLFVCLYWFFDQLVLVYYIEYMRRKKTNGR